LSDGLAARSPAATAVVDDAANDADLNETLMQFLYRAPIGLVQIAPDGTVEMINPKSAQLLMPIARAGNLDNLFAALDGCAPQLRGLVDAYEAPNGLICNALRMTIDGGVGGPRVLSIDLTKLDSTRLMAVIADATAEAEREREELARHLRHAARVDALTAMPNRTALLERVQIVLDREPIDPGYEFAVLFINCDRFKQINDSFGHQVGDEVLASMAGRLRATLRPSDRIGRSNGVEQMAARVSGDEFVVLLEDLHRPGDVHIVANRLLKALAKPYVIGGHPLHCSVSIGIVSRAQAQATIDADALLQDASIAMHEAKREGGGCYAVFEVSMRQRVERRGGIEAELRVALAEEQLFVVYQPVVGMPAAGGSDGAAGVEALVRWRHPVRGIVPPIEFIGVAEECGLIGALGDFVLSAACRQFMTWQAALGADAPRLLAVNLSRAQLASDDLVASVEAALRAAGMPASLLQLEVTESLAAQDEAIQQRLHDLKALGLALALDDFGTGYSSLSSLHLLPVDVVKIDRSFVSLADTSAHHRVLIEATIRVARSLGMGTVAEGIETEAQADVIRELGCDKGQGYLFSRPLMADDVAPWLVAQASPSKPTR
jgi:diguanylate cyclase (GGDEF)-like protein